MRVQHADPRPLGDGVAFDGAVEIDHAVQHDPGAPVTAIGVELLDFGATVIGLHLTALEDGVLGVVAPGVEAPVEVDIVPIGDQLVVQIRGDIASLGGVHGNSSVEIG